MRHFSAPVIRSLRSLTSLPMVAPSAFPEGLGLGGSKIRERSDLIKGARRKNYGLEEERKHISASSPAKRGA